MKAAACSQALPLPRSRVADFVELTKPRIAVLVLFTVAAGAWLASPAGLEWLQLVHVLFGTALVAAGASALNQVIERHSDALMRRTENRPLPAGRLGVTEATVFGFVLGLGGLAYLSAFLQHSLAVVIAAVTFVGYVLIYTPLKRYTTLNTLIGAVPGALPPVIGWTAVTGRLDPGAGVLFLIVFIWQVPHFLAIAWMCRDDYARAGLKMLPVADAEGTMTGRQMIAYCLALIPVSLLPVMHQQASAWYAGLALVLGLAFLAPAVLFLWRRSTLHARRVLYASLLYLPGLFGLLLMEKFLG